MLNISINKNPEAVSLKRFKSYIKVSERSSGRVLLKILYWCFGTGLVFLFLPWTQNIRADGKVTTLYPSERPQTLPSVIAGRIEKWFIREGNFVEKGDTILFISEIKDEYFDPNLLGRTKDQLKAKESTVQSYMEKVKALDMQIDAMVETGDLKLQQARNKLQQAKLKVQSDSIKFEAAKTNLKIAEKQYTRLEKLHEDGLKSLTDLENRKLTLQKTQAELIETENQLLSSKNEVINAKVELTSIRANYRDKIAKAESEKFTALSSMYDSEALVTKLQNQYMNYSIRNSMYYITAPQDGYITKTYQNGIGETIKEGTPILTIMPADYSIATELYVDPIDLPLIDIGQEVRIQFDGWPAIVFSGWPNTSYGTYGGKVFAIDKYISDNGKFRVLVAPDPNDHEWPDALRVGGGTKNMLLLKDVPIWYELWRQINGFPPDFYKAPKNDINFGKFKEPK
ncbi:MAG: HlyD family efflux transporter periplasmic adaptor subunit [Vicingaceae bacterium]